LKRNPIYQGEKKAQLRVQAGNNARYEAHNFDVLVPTRAGSHS